ncbi:hypothetical protein ACXWPL_09325, partial [Streptococcus pyogenes]
RYADLEKQIGPKMRSGVQVTLKGTVNVPQGGKLMIWQAGGTQDGSVSTFIESADRRMEIVKSGRQSGNNNRVVPVALDAGTYEIEWYLEMKL